MPGFDYKSKQRIENRNDMTLINLVMAGVSVRIRVRVRVRNYHYHKDMHVGKLGGERGGIDRVESAKRHPKKWTNKTWN